MSCTSLVPFTVIPLGHRTTFLMPEKEVIFSDVTLMQFPLPSLKHLSVSTNSPWTGRGPAPPVYREQRLMYARDISGLDNTNQLIIRPGLGSAYQLVCRCQEKIITAGRQNSSGVTSRTTGVFQVITSQQMVTNLLIIKGSLVKNVSDDLWPSCLSVCSNESLSGVFWYESGWHVTVTTFNLWLTESYQIILLSLENICWQFIVSPKKLQKKLMDKKTT